MNEKRKCIQTVFNAITIIAEEVVKVHLIPLSVKIDRRVLKQLDLLSLGKRRNHSVPCERP